MIQVTTMQCHRCAQLGQSEDAVGLCTVCGRAACLQHAVVQQVPQYRQSSAGIGGPYVRLPVDRARFVCAECAATMGPPSPILVEG